ncbi:MAG: ABC transporter ATP-binding protein [Deltaproteobacteria bacterium GWC2_56_8]|nr:MAG: ABC transporter ATP-binding protein [Deltaproteobacteria bacterium GWB2_55_19]OGP37796.1 MAG: ABC transporter ATP-binding protein [Deltaproteobacteria bacterium GWC2_56_8]
MTPVLEIKDLKTYFKTPRGVAKAVDGVSFSIPKGGTFALVGESGCGKSMTALSVIQLVPEPAGYIAGGRVLLNGRDITGLTEREKRGIRGNNISMIFQEPMTSLNPVLTIGEQIIEAITLHQGKTRKEAREAAIEMLGRVRLPDPAALLFAYPHSLSGGMRQRVMIAIALSCRPDLLIADEPTTALDVTIQAQIIDLIDELKRETSTAVLLITHNMALVYTHAETVGVMYAGKIVELAPAKTLFRNPMHPYTVKLLRSIPGQEKRGLKLDTIPGVVPSATSYPVGCRFSGRCPREMEGCAVIEPPLVERVGGHSVACHLHDAEFMSGPYSRPLRHEPDALPPLIVPHGEREALLEVKGLKTHYPIRKGLFKRVAGHLKAVDGIDLTVKKGSTLALVGESGCGKTTAGKSIIQLIRPTEGRIIFKGADLTTLSEKGLKPFRSRMQIIFQDPYSSLNPRLTVKETIEEGIKALNPGLAKKAREEKIARTLDRVGLGPEAMLRYPHEFSGGQRQRVGIARALAVDPEFIVCDEAVSALDVSVQAQILNLLKSIQRDFGLSFLFITHDLGVVEYIADEVAVMYEGRIVEQGPTEEIFSNPKDAYTKRLLEAVPKIDASLLSAWRLPGDH